MIGATGSKKREFGPVDEGLECLGYVCGGLPSDHGGRHGSRDGHLNKIYR